ncbi:MAG: phosphoribosylformylglycinamidine synthase subunit PurS [Candidatus Saganbacteria bacterium]|nr:phosphoribosylformylglycinamidine synthase subunit PurS [Candidatus Saganbacteria bacterium]
MYLVKVFVRHKKGILDPQGKTIKDALHALKYTSVSEVKIGKLIDIKIDAKSIEDTRHQVSEMCKKLLANPVVEQYTFEIEEI